MSKNGLRLVTKAILFLVGCFILAVGVDLYFKSNIGGDATSALLDGVKKSFQIEPGYTSMAINLIAIILLIIFDKKKIGLGTIIIVFCYGPILNFVLQTSIISPVSHPALSILYCVMGCILVGIGIGLWLSLKSGYSPIEGVLDFVATKFDIKFAFIKILLDILFLLLAISLGGTVFYGTVITALLTGPLIQFFTKTCTKIAKKVT